MTASNQVPPRLHELEALVMEEVWRQGSVTVRSVMEALNEDAGKARAYTTYMTILARLHRKGVLDRRRHGKTDVYDPRLTRDEYLEARARSEVAALVQQYGDVALAHFARQMASLDPERRKQLRRLVRRG
jgi:predicted transcriptional regulator